MPGSGPALAISGLVMPGAISARISAWVQDSQAARASRRSQPNAIDIPHSPQYRDLL
jgi:hypothetical protein